MFRLQNNVPEVYVQKSRDFQLFCRLYDSVFGGVKFSIDSLQYATDAKNCDIALLELVKTKLGLFTDIELSDTELRLVLQAFPSIMRYKGSLKGIWYIIRLFQRIAHDSTSNATLNEDTMNDNYTIIITFDQEVVNGELLYELLKYIVPTGYLIEYDISAIKNISSRIGSADSIQAATVRIKENSRIRKDSTDGITPLHTVPNPIPAEFNNLYGTVGLTEIVNKSDLEESSNE